MSVYNKGATRFKNCGCPSLFHVSSSTNVQLPGAWPEIFFFLEGGGVEILSLTGNETKLQLGSEGL